MTTALGPRPVLTPNEIELIRDEYGPTRVVNLLRDHPSSAHADLPNKPDKTNWVEKAGGLPSYIKRIAKHLVADQGMSVSHAIASAVNTVKRWAAGGGKTTAKTKAKASAAVADWERKRGQSATKSLVREVEEFLMTQSQMPTRFVELSGAPPFKKGNQSGTPKKGGGKSGPPQSVINSGSSKTPDSKGGGGSSGPPAFVKQSGGGNSGPPRGNGRSGVPQSVQNSSSPNTPNGNGGSGGPPSNAPSGSPSSKPTVTDAASAKAAIAKAAAGNPSPTLIAYLKKKAAEFGVDASSLSANGDHGSGGSSGTSSMPAFLGKGRRG